MKPSPRSSVIPAERTSELLIHGRPRHPPGGVFRCAAAASAKRALPAPGTAGHRPTAAKAGNVVRLVVDAGVDPDGSTDLDAGRRAWDLDKAGAIERAWVGLGAWRRGWNRIRGQGPLGFRRMLGSKDQARQRGKDDGQDRNGECFHSPFYRSQYARSSHCLSLTVRFHISGVPQQNGLPRRKAVCAVENAHLSQSTFGTLCGSLGTARMAPPKSLSVLRADTKSGRSRSAPDDAATCSGSQTLPN